MERETDKRADGGKRVGEVARATGLTVRTLHYYDEIGLLVPSDRSEAGYRLYSATDLERLYRILRLRKIGMTLEDIGHALDDADWHLAAALGRHLDQLDRQLAVGHRLRQGLATIANTLSASKTPSTQEFLAVLEEMTMVDSTVQRRIPGLVYADIEAAYTYLIEVFRLEPGRLDRDEHGTVVHGEVTAGDGVIWLHRVAPEFGLDSPLHTGVETAGLSVLVDDVDAHYLHVKACGATIVHELADMPYGVREYDVRDLENRLWSFMTPTS
ncbi:MAG TPA: MerR family transcriptional regulator [Pseudonocardiaceae bacterium]|jgi:DNA-binding transcriptional MerR regulator|nr:MerR family transcriptional regulator [Pseudonocardiaceae bacterium]